jgi:hypothetical protein
MLFARFRTSRFARAVAAYGLQRCSRNGTIISIGLGPHADYDRHPVTALPAEPEKLCFMEGPLQAELVAALVASPEARTLRRLMIGTSHAYDKKAHAAGYDMMEAVAALRGAQLPALTLLSLGDMELFYNGHPLYGSLGDVTHIFAAAPQMETLQLHGDFTLSAPVRHDRLTDFTVTVDDIGCCAGPVSQETVDHLLSSSFPSLTRLDLRLNDDGGVGKLAIPEAFFHGDGFPGLRAFDMDHLLPAAAARLTIWKQERGLS